VASYQNSVLRYLVVSISAQDQLDFESRDKDIQNDIDTEESLTYTIVSSPHSNPDIGNISFHSPLAKQLLGKSEGDEFTAHLPGGKKEFEVEEVYFDESKLC